MAPPDTSRRRWLWGLLALSAALLLVRLGDGRMWQDEAQTALVARTVLQGGVPRGSDGLNYFSQELGAEYGPGLLWRWHTWLPFYLLAGFFKLFGEGTFIARLPFALAGLATVAATWALGRRLWRSEQAGLVAAGLLAVNVPFLLLARQCRSYPLAQLFFTLGLLAWHGVLEGRRRAAAALVLAATLLFHVHYLYTALLLVSILAHAVLAERAALKTALLASLVTTLVNLPWVLWFAQTNYLSRYGSDHRTLSVVGRNLRGFSDGLFLESWPLAFLAALVVLGLVANVVAHARSEPSARSPTGGRWERSAFALLGLCAAAHLAVLSLTSPGPFYRYLAPLLPVGCVLLAKLALRAAAGGRLQAALLAATVLFASPLPAFLGQLSHTYRGPVDALVEWLAVNAQRGQTIAITYEDLPLKFYTPLRVLGGLTGEDLEPARRADFIVLRHETICEKDAAVADWLRRNVDFSAYQRIELDAADARFQNRETVGEHQFRSPQGGPRVDIFRRLR